MNDLNLIAPGLFASKKDLKALSKKENASVLIYSDSHGNGTVVTDIFRNFGNKVDAVLFSGDGIYDLLSVLEKSKSYKEVQEWLPPVIGFCRGNNDFAKASASFKEEIDVPKKLVVEIGKKKILLTHGHEDGAYYSTELLEYAAKQNGCKAVVFGHTHVPVENNFSVYSVNPGSVSLPRRRSKPSLAVMQVGNNFFNSIFYSIQQGVETCFVPFHPEPFA